MTEEEFIRNADEQIEKLKEWKNKNELKKALEEAEECYTEKLSRQQRDRVVASKSKMRKREVDVMKKKLFIAGMSACFVISAIGVTRSVARGRIAQRVIDSGLVPRGVNSSESGTINYVDSYGNPQMFGAEYFVSMFSEEDMKKYGVTPDEFAIYLGKHLGIAEGIVEGSTVLGREKLCLEELGVMIIDNIDEQVEEAISGTAYLEDEKMSEGRSR